jgi:hypothetical protein
MSDKPIREWWINQDNDGDSVYSCETDEFVHVLEAPPEAERKDEGV